MKFEDVKLVKKICRMKEDVLHNFLLKTIQNMGYKNIYNTNMYLMAEGTYPICLCAHLDTVFPAPPSEIFYDNQNKVMWSPQGIGTDDRAGVFIILKILQAGLRPSLVFTHGEEIGGKGADAIVTKYGDCPFENCKALIQLDRQGFDDAVYYDCDNKDFETLITSYGFKTEWGTFSDISLLAPIWEIAAVNLSVGYIREHNLTETFYTEAAINTYYKVCKMIEDSTTEWSNYAYIPTPYTTKYRNFFGGYDTLSPLEDDDDEEFFSTLMGKKCWFCGNDIKDGENHYQYDGYNLCTNCYSYCFT